MHKEKILALDMGISKTEAKKSGEGAAAEEEKYFW